MNSDPTEVAEDASEVNQPRFRLPDIGRFGVRVTCGWDLNYLAADDVHLAKQARECWTTVNGLRYSWPATGLQSENPFVTQLATVVRDDLAQLESTATRIAERVALDRPELHGGSNRESHKEATDTLTRAWLTLASEAHVASESVRLAPAITEESLALFEAAAALLPPWTIDLAELFDVLRNLGGRYDKSYIDELFNHLASRISRRWREYYRRSKQTDIRKALTRRAQECNLSFSAAKQEIIRAEILTTLERIAKPQKIRDNHQWIKRFSARGRTIRARVWLPDQDPYLAWRVLGNQCIRGAENFITAEYPEYRGNAADSDSYATSEPEDENEAWGGCGDPSSAVEMQLATEKLIQAGLEAGLKAGLSSRQSEVLYALHLGNETPAEIATRLGISRSTVYVHRHRGLKKQRNKLTRNGGL